MANPALEIQEQLTKEEYKMHKRQFERKEERAHKDYLRDRDMGMVERGQDFYQWAAMNAPAAEAAKSSMMRAAGQLSRMWAQSRDPEEASRGDWFMDPWVVFPGRQSVRKYDQDVDGKRAKEQAEVDKHLRLD